MNRVVFLRCAALLALVPVRPTAQEAGAFAVTGGADTVALERFSRQTTRAIFKDDSVAVDQASRSSGVKTLIFPTTRSPIAYLNLSVPLMEQATRRAEASEFRFNVDRDGRILGGAVASQGLSITRGAGR